MTTRTVGVFGGSFDPPHASHVLFATYALAVAPIDEVLVVPTFDHPFGKDMAPYGHRLAMCERAFASLRGVTISRIEEELGGESFTVRTLEALKARAPDVALRLLIGGDVLPQTPRWRSFDRVAELAPPFVIGREGATPIESAPSMPAISSTAVRARYRSGDDVSRLVPRAVDAYVRANGLYGT